MALSLAANSPLNVTIRAGVAAVVIISVFGIAALVMPPKCIAGGSGACPDITADLANTAPVVMAPPSPQIGAGSVAQPALVQAGAPVAPAPVATAAFADTKPTGESLVSSTFKMLQGRSSSAAIISKASAPVAQQPAPQTAADGLAIRKVQTMAVAAPAAAAANVTATAQLAEPAATKPAAQPAIPVPAPLAQQPDRAEPAPSTAKPHSSAANVMLVGGAGVNVRSSPSMAKGKKLYAIAPNERVTIVGHQHGWDEIVDTRGHRGWVYSNYLRKPQA